MPSFQNHRVHQQIRAKRELVEGRVALEIAAHSYQNRRKLKEKLGDMEIGIPEKCA